MNDGILFTHALARRDRRRTAFYRNLLYLACRTTNKLRTCILSPHRRVVGPDHRRHRLFFRVEHDGAGDRHHADDEHRWRVEKAGACGARNVAIGLVMKMIAGWAEVFLSDV